MPVYRPNRPCGWPPSSATAILYLLLLLAVIPMAGDAVDPIPIRIHIHWISDRLDRLDESQLTGLKNSVRIAVSRIESSVLVNEPLKVPLLLDRADTYCKSIDPNTGKCAVLNSDYLNEGETCSGLSDFKIPNEHLKELSEYRSGKKKVLQAAGAGLSNTDIVLYITSLQQNYCLDGNVHAYANFCKQENKRRPLAGYINFCPQKVPSNLPENVFSDAEGRLLVATAMHEIVHVLGFSAELFPQYDGGNPLEKNSVTGQWWFKGRATRSWAESHFGCVDGIAMDEVAKGAAHPSHWHPVFMHSALMSPELHSSAEVYLDPASLLALQDSGWYTALVKNADFFRWGQDAGSCDFHTTCTDSKYFCKELSSVGCTIGLSAAGSCTALTSSSGSPCNTYLRTVDSQICKYGRGQRCTVYIETRKSEKTEIITESTKAVCLNTATNAGENDYSLIRDQEPHTCDGKATEMVPLNTASSNGGTQIQCFEKKVLFNNWLRRYLPKTTTTSTSTSTTSTTTTSTPTKFTTTSASKWTEPPKFAIRFVTMDYGNMKTRGLLSPLQVACQSMLAELLVVPLTDIRIVRMWAGSVMVAFESKNAGYVMTVWMNAANCKVSEEDVIGVLETAVKENSLTVIIDGNSYTATEYEKFDGSEPNPQKTYLTEKVIGGLAGGMLFIALIILTTLLILKHKLRGQTQVRPGSADSDTSSVQVEMAGRSSRTMSVGHGAPAPAGGSMTPPAAVAVCRVDVSAGRRESIFSEGRSSASSGPVVYQPMGPQLPGALLLSPRALSSGSIKLEHNFTPTPHHEEF